MNRDDNKNYWSHEHCTICGQSWWWEFHNGMDVGHKWPCGCPTDMNPTVVLKSIPLGCLNVIDEVNM